MLNNYSKFKYMIDTKKNKKIYLKFSHSRGNTCLARETLTIPCKKRGHF